MWKGSSRSLFRTLVLENSKFLLFVLTPVFTASLFWNDSVVDYIVRSRQYVTYPPEGERPLSPAESALTEMQRSPAARVARASPPMPSATAQRSREEGPRVRGRPRSRSGGFVVEGV